MEFRFLNIGCFPVDSKIIENYTLLNYVVCTKELFAKLIRVFCFKEKIVAFGILFEDNSVF